MRHGWHAIRKRGQLLLMFVRQRAFLARLLASTLLAVFIPLILSSAQFINRETATLQQAEQAQLRAATQSITRQFDMFIDRAQEIAIKVLLSSKLHENVLSSSIEAEMDGLETLSNYLSALPFVSNFGLYVAGESSAVYTNDGKYRPGIFTARVLGLNEALFLRYMSETVSPTFYPLGCANGNSMLYVIPLRTGSSTKISRSCVYVITARSLESALSNLLADKYAVAAIYDPNGQLLYSDGSGAWDFLSILSKDEPPMAINQRELMLEACTGGSDYTVFVSASKSGLYQNMKSLSDHIRQLSLLNVLICAALIAMVVLLNYRPIRSIFIAIRDFGKMPLSHNSELAYIASAYSHLIAESDMLSSELIEKNRLILDRVLEKLISGKHCSPQELRHIPFQRPIFYVVNARRADIANTDAILEKNTMDADRYAIEMVTDGVLCFICGGLEEGPDCRAKLSRRLHDLVGLGVRLGFSAPCPSIDRLSLAYTDALHALYSAPENLDVYADECLREEAFTLDMESQALSDLAFAIKNGNDTALDLVRRMFAQVSTTSSLMMQRYACIRLIESCRAISQSVGVLLDPAQIAQILSEESAFGIRDRFVTLLEGCMKERQKEVDEQNSRLYADILQFINGHFTDPALCLNDIAEHMGVSIYTTSRFMKNASGIGFRKYLNDLRIEYAKDLLITTQLSIQEIAVRSGFASASYFVNVFKKMENTTPNHYRGQTQC